MNAREIVKEIIADKAGTTDADCRVFEAAVDIVLSVSSVRKCHDCRNVSLHRDNITPYVLCPKCGSQDTRLIK